MATRPSFLVRMAVGVAAVSSGGVLARLAAGAAPLAITAWRLVLASCVLVPAALVRGTLGTIGRRDLALGVASGAALALHFVLWISSLAHTSVASSVLFVSTHPIFVAIGGALALGERVSARTAIGIAIAIAGGAVVGSSDLSLGAWVGDLLALGGGFFAAVYFLLGRRLRQRLSLVDYTAVSYGTAAVLSLAACLALGVPLAGYAPITYLWLGLLALGPQLIGHSTFNWALRHLPAAKVSVLILGEPVGAAVLAYFVFGETLSWLRALGAAVVLLGIYVSVRGKEGGDDARA